MVNTYYYNGNEYRPSTVIDREKGFWLGSAASAAILSILPLCGKPFDKQLREEYSNNHLYKDAFEKSIEKTGLDKKGVGIIPAQIFLSDTPEKLGKNAFYNLESKKITINTQKISIAGFHELGHAMNDLQGKFGKFLSKLRWPGRAAAGYLGYVALFSRTKPKEAPDNKWDWIKNNCGKLAFLCMLPTVMEEGMASYKGVKVARRMGLSEVLLKNMKKLYVKALFTYVGHAVLTGLAVGAASTIMDKFSRPRRVNSFEFLER